jgi:hypothetical protein
MLSLSGCAGLESERVKQERAAHDEWVKALPIIDKSDLPDADKKSWHLFAKNEEFRIKQEEEAVK